MEKEQKLVNKVKRLIRQADYPRYINRFGPKNSSFGSYVRTSHKRAI